MEHSWLQNSEFHWVKAVIDFKKENDKITESYSFSPRCWVAVDAHLEPQSSTDSVHCSLPPSARARTTFMPSQSLLFSPCSLSPWYQSVPIQQRLWVLILKISRNVILFYSCYLCVYIYIHSYSYIYIYHILRMYTPKIAARVPTRAYI